jgi:high-affinity nickel-transport protein
VGRFLYVIAPINILLGIVKVFREMSTGRYDEAGLERQLDSRGLMNRQRCGAAHGDWDAFRR